MEVNPYTYDQHDLGETVGLQDAYQTFVDIKDNSDGFAKSYGSVRCWDEVYPKQASLVTQYVVEAFSKLGSDLSLLNTGGKVPPIQHLPRYALLATRLFEILEDARLVRRQGKASTRTNRPLAMQSASQQLQKILDKFPRHSSEQKLLSITGSSLADCITGAADPLTLVFRSKENASILEDVYTNGPFYLAATYGLVMLVEFTKGLYWFDLGFGLMDGWWSMTDGRKHVLADEFSWKRGFDNARFGYVDWTRGDIAESNMLRIIAGFKTRPKVRDIVLKKRFDIQTVMFKQTDQNRLFADVYLPTSHQLMSQTWSIALEQVEPPDAILAFYSPSKLDDESEVSLRYGDHG
ncbi:polyketide synthase [Colletotrichum chrysophilum]|uniref:Polyketide synthase n=1 Tax=Colletotrichum chrysophilum TaxID=1836956 RepID=A0AAD8ZY91_9PEZI|nr:polyketide synthase [Colletotrichum chrysophilum]